MFAEKTELSYKQIAFSRTLGEGGTRERDVMSSLLRKGWRSLQPTKIHINKFYYIISQLYYITYLRIFPYLLDFSLNFFGFLFAQTH